MSLFSKYRRPRVLQISPLRGWFLLVICIAGLTGILTPGHVSASLGLPGLSELGVPHLDKMLHFSFLLVLTLGFAQRAKTNIGVLLVVGAMVAFGVGTEALQRLTPDRQISHFDIAANLAGVVAAALIIIAKCRLKRPSCPLRP